MLWLVTTVLALALFAVVLWALRLRDDRARMTSARMTRERVELAWRLACATAREPLGFLDDRMCWSYVDDRMQRYLGRRRDEVLGTKFDDLFRPPALASVHATVQRVVDGEADSETITAMLAAGAEVAVRVSSLAATGSARARCCVHIVDDAELQRKLTLLRVTERALHAAASGVVICDALAPDLPIIYVNAEFERMTGYGANEVLGRNCRFLNEGEPDQPGLDEVRAALREQRATSVTLRNFKRDGTAFWNELTISPVVDPEGRMTHFIGIQDDISERMEFGVERERLLAESIADKQSAARAAKARETLLQVVSHELRSPLNAIRLWTSLLQSEHCPDESLVRRAIAQIDAGVTQQSRIIEDLLDVSRFESGRLELQLGPVDLVEITADTARRNEPLAAARGITLAWQVPDAKVVVRADRGRIEQVLQNLIDNAVKFTARGGSVEISLSSADTQARVSVRDTGRGIDRDHLAAVFDQFWQADDRDARRHGGLGLGLNLVKRIVERHDGVVQADSEGRGKGSTFTFELPLQEGVDPAAQPAEPRRVTGGSCDGDMLVVDDDGAAAEALALGLQMRGHPVRVANSAERALQLIAERRPRVVISDLMMAEMTGIELIEAIRAEEFQSGAARTPAIAITGRGNPSDRRRVRVAGFDRYLKKPIRLQVLVEMLQELLEREQRDSSAVVLVACAELERGDALRMELGTHGHEVQVAASAADALALIDARRPDVLVAAAELVDGSGSALLDSVSREHDDVLTVLMVDERAAGEPVGEHTICAAGDVEGLRCAISRWLPL